MGARTRRRGTGSAPVAGRDTVVVDPLAGVAWVPYEAPLPWDGEWVTPWDTAFGPPPQPPPDATLPVAGDPDSAEARWELLASPDDPAGVDPDGAAGADPGATLMARIAAAEGLMTQLAATQAHCIERLYRLRCGQVDPQAPACAVDPDAWVPPEVALTLGVSVQQVRKRLLYADALTRFQHLRRLVHDGGTPSFTAMVLAEGLDRLAGLVDPADLDRLEEDLVAWLRAERPTVGAVGRRLQALLLDAEARAKITTDEGVARHHHDRHVRITGNRNGTAELWALLPETDALAVAAALRALGRSKTDPADPRSAAQRRTDILVGRLTGAPAAYGRDGDVPTSHRDITITVRIDATIPVDTLTGDGTAPGHIDGYGPVPAETCRDLPALAGTRFRALLYDTTDGHLLGLAPTGDLTTIRWLSDVRPAKGYSHPTTMDELIHARDRLCRYAHCTRPATHCDTDHIIAHPHGPTSPDNAAAMCRFHHRLKTHAPRWKITGSGTGPLLWRTPTGYTATTTPHDYRPPTTHPDDDPPPF